MKSSATALGAKKSPKAIFDGTVGEKWKNWLIVAYILIIIVGLITTFWNESNMAEVFAMPANKKIVVIDPGHGGWDPGKVGDNSIIEKDINLKIAEKLQGYLLQGGAMALITRAEDEALGQKKREDLRARKNLAQTGQADIFISIHQNSYPDSGVRGAQAFYYGESEKSKMLADAIQEQVGLYLDKENKRLAKANMDYYLLKETVVPAVIVECGFISNPSEANSLTEDEYQNKIAWAIYMGVLNYFSGKTVEN